MEKEEMTCGSLIKENYELINGINEIVREFKRNVFGGDSLNERVEKESSKECMVEILQMQNIKLKGILEDLGCCVRTLMI